MGFDTFKANSDTKVEVAVIVFRSFIATKSRDDFSRRKGQNMISNAKVEAVWKTTLAMTNTKLSATEYKRGLSAAWNVVRDTLFVVEC
jgi:hypothetical protein